MAGLIGLLGALPMTVISWGLAVSVSISAFFFRPDNYGSRLAARQAIHLVLVGLALWFVVMTIESPNTDSSYYRPIYFWFLGLPFLLVAPALRRLIFKKEAQQAAPSNGG